MNDQRHWSVIGPNTFALLDTDTPLSFWGGVDPNDGTVIDRHHPLHGQSLSGRVLAMPGSRGSCSGSGVLLELLSNGHAPVALLFTEDEEILTLGAVVADELFGLSLPVLRIDSSALAGCRHDEPMIVRKGYVGIAADGVQLISTAPDAQGPRARFALSETDRGMLDGSQGEAASVAMRILVRMALHQGASMLLDVTRAHIDGCIYSGPSSLCFAERLAGLGARVRVPTTLNALSVDCRRWRAAGVDPALGEPAVALGAAYVTMGATPSYTCAPYLLDDPPIRGERIGWAESNAIMFANSVLGARTQKIPDFLDICIAITGRAAACGCYLDDGRQPTLRISVVALPGADDAFWPLLGHHLGTLAGHHVPLVTGLEHSRPERDDLKAFCAAFATTSSAALCHIAGVTPETIDGSVSDGADLLQLEVTRIDLCLAWQALNYGPDEPIDLVCLGNPHFSFEECAALATLCDGIERHAGTDVIVTLGRAIHERARRAGHVATMERFGIRFVTDTCWCMVQEPLIPPAARTLMTNSAKYAHYGPGLVERVVHFGSLAECVSAARLGFRAPAAPVWLRTGI